MIKITNMHGLTKEDIKHKIRKSNDIREHERWICINSCIEGYTAPEIACIIDRDEQTIRDWITGFNEDGIEGLKRENPKGKKKD